MVLISPCLTMTLAVPECNSSCFLKREGGNVAKISDIFQCTRCGYCCHGETTVSLDEEDQSGMIAVLGGSKEQVCGKYWRVSEPITSADKKSNSAIVQMKTVAGRCIFYCEDENGLGGCVVHNARPWRCRQWPLHPAILGDESNFNTIRESCPGINRDLSYLQFCAILGELMQKGKIEC